MKLGISLTFLLSFLSHLALFRIFQTRIISKKKSQNSLIFGDYGFRLFFGFAMKTVFTQGKSMGKQDHDHKKYNFRKGGEQNASLLHEHDLLASVEDHWRNSV